MSVEIHGGTFSNLRVRINAEELSKNLETLIINMWKKGHKPGGG
ncbi:MAG: hypothetical protein ABIJ21_06800 [Nanoarchaeota archaeon]